MSERRSTQPSTNGMWEGKRGMPSTNPPTVEARSREDRQVPTVRDSAPITVWTHQPSVVRLTPPHQRRMYQLTRLNEPFHSELLAFRRSSVCSFASCQTLTSQESTRGGEAPSHGSSHISQSAAQDARIGQVRQNMLPERGDVPFCVSRMREFLASPQFVPHPTPSPAQAWAFFSSCSVRPYLQTHPAGSRHRVGRWASKEPTNPRLTHWIDFRPLHLRARRTSRFGSRLGADVDASLMGVPQVPLLHKR
jgi:hypothetical protein